MYVLPPVHELTLIGIFDPGIPNRERIVLRPTQQLNLAGFALILGVGTDDGGVMPIQDHFLWLGERWIAPPSWIVVFTGPGAFGEGVHETSGESVLELHWGRTAVVLGRPGIVVGVLRIGALSSHLTPVSAPVAAVRRLRRPGEQTP